MEFIEHSGVYLGHAFVVVSYEKPVTEARARQVALLTKGEVKLTTVHVREWRGIFDTQVGHKIILKKRGDSSSPFTEGAWGIEEAVASAHRVIDAGVESGTLLNKRPELVDQ